MAKLYGLCDEGKSLMADRSAKLRREVARIEKDVNSDTNSEEAVGAKPVYNF